MDKKADSANGSGRPRKNIWYTLIRIIKIMTLLLFMVVLFSGGAAAGYVASLVKSDPVRSYNEIYNKINNNNLTGFAYFRDKSLIGQLQTEEDRQLVSLDQVSPHFIDAIISAEDRYFYQHHGVVPSSIARAGLQQLSGSSVQTGGSTLTQQLIKQTILSPKQTMDRKFKEIFLALRTERMFTKDQILTAYINKMYLGQKYGSNLYGIETAANSIFGVSAKQLNIAQSAYLAGMFQAPYSYSPFKKPGGLKAGTEREKYVLSRMLEDHKISQSEYEDALKYNIGAHLNTKPKEKAFDKYPYLTVEIEDRAAAELLKQDMDKNPDLKKQNYQTLLEDKKKEIRQGGYHIYTTIDKNLYDKMQRIGSNPDNFGPNLTYYIGNKKWANQPEQVGAVLVQNKTGAILGMIEGRGFQGQQFSHVTHPRQPGSTMKPLSAYAPALELGLVQPASIIDDSPIDINGWQPKNDDLNWHGGVTARQALASSYNIPAIKTYLKTGINESLAYVRKMGVTTLTNEDNYAPSGVIGGLTQGLTVEQITNAYATFANQGNFVHSYMIERIENSNHEVIYQHKTNSLPVFSPQTAWLITDMMRSVVQEGTASGVIPNYIGKEDVAGKTGTTSDNKDKWFVGYSPDVSIGVWVGFDQPYTIPHYSYYRAQNIWGKIFSTVINTEPELSPASHKMSMPAGIVQRTVDLRNGKLASGNSGPVTTDYFNEKYVPQEYSNEPAPVQTTDPGTTSKTADPAKQPGPNNPSNTPPADNGGNTGAQKQSQQQADSKQNPAVHKTTEPPPAQTNKSGAGQHKATKHQHTTHTTHAAHAAHTAH
jgi:penicillin-binding protein 1B